jgi:hypothetical protein
MKLASYEIDDVIFQQGDNSREVYRLLSGKVQIAAYHQEKPVTVAELRSGQIFGEMALVDERPRAATAQCIEAAVCEVMTPEDFQSEILRISPAFLPYLGLYFERLLSFSERLHLQMHQPSPPPPVLIKKPAVSESTIPLWSEGIFKSAEPAKKRMEGCLTLKAMPSCVDQIPPEFSDETITSFPYLIGRKSQSGDDIYVGVATNQLLIWDSAPYQVSRNHCAIERNGDQFFVTDYGSTLGTIVNGNPIGENQATQTCPLVKGVNTLILGMHKSPYVFHIEWD